MASHGPASCRPTSSAAISTYNRPNVPPIALPSWPEKDFSAAASFPHSTSQSIGRPIDVYYWTSPNHTRLRTYLEDQKINLRALRHYHGSIEELWGC
jgi:hypothetical protein